MCVYFNSEGRKVTIATAACLSATEGYEFCLFKNGVRSSWTKPKIYNGRINSFGCSGSSIRSRKLTIRSPHRLYIRIVVLRFGTVGTKFHQF